VRCDKVDDMGSFEGDGDDDVCAWTGPLDSLKGHMLTCGHALIQCDHQGCSFTAARRRIATHKMTCVHRPAKCKGCGMLMPGEHMARHLAEDCPEEPVACLLASCGCEVRPRRKRLAAHLAEYATEHAALCEAVANKLIHCQAIIDGGGDWVPEETLALASLERMRVAAEGGDEEKREEIYSCGALQMAVGHMQSRRQSSTIQISGCRAILSVCANRGGGLGAVNGLALNAARFAGQLGGRTGVLRGSDDASSAPYASPPPPPPPPPPASRAKDTSKSPRPPPSASRLSKVGFAMAMDSPRDGMDACGSIAGSNRRLQAAADAGAIDVAVDALKAFPDDRELQRLASDVLSCLCGGGEVGIATTVAASGAPSGTATRRANAAARGAIEQLVKALRKFNGADEGSTQAAAAGALRTICAGEDEAAEACRTRASDADGIEALCVTMMTRPRDTCLQEHCCKALANVTYGGDAAGRRRKLRAADAGAIDATAACANIFPPEHTLAGREAVRALVALLAGLESLTKARQQRAADVGALRIVVQSLIAPTSGGQTTRYMAARYRALRNLTRNNEALQKAAKDAGARAEWL